MMFSDIDSLSDSELKALKSLNEETIIALERNIKALKWQVQQFGPLAERPSLHSVSAGQSHPAQSDLINKYQEEIEQLNARIQQTSELSGITIDKITRQVMELDENHSKIHFELTLKVLGKVMYLKYEIDELLFADDPLVSNKKRLTWVEVKIDQKTNKAIGDTLTKAIDEISIQSALALIKSYIQFAKESESVIQHFVQTFPDTVSHSNHEGINCLDISYLKLSQPVFGIEFGIKYKSNCWIEPDIKLKIKASDKLKALDKKQVFESSPAMFATLIADRGLKSAIECIVRLVISTN